MTYQRPKSTRLVQAIPGIPAHKVYRLRKARGTTPRVPVDRARAHVRRLLELGLTKEAIARAAGIAPGHAARIAFDSPADPPKRLIDRRVERAVLAVTHMPHPRQAVCLAIGARRRAEALAALGWSMTWQAQQLGKATANYCGEISKTRVSYPTWVAVRDLYDQHCMTLGPSTKAASIAKARGWVPPLAWDDDAIDDPAAQPATEAGPSDDVDELAIERALAGANVTLTDAERLIVVTRLVADGLSDAAIAKRLHVTDRTVLRWRQAHGLESRWAA